MGAKFYLLLLISFTVSVCNADYTYDIKWFPNMPIDHFSYADNRTFSLRYLVNNTHWKPHGPVFFYCGNEGDIELFAQNTGFMWDIAGEYNAMVVFAEHRFYGKTMPFGNQSYDSPGNLGYLSSEQALADYAKLLTWMKQNETSLGPVVAFGGSYGGMLAAWFRVKYPHVIVGAVASSAPILQFEGVTPCWTFGQIVTRTFARSGTNCDMVVKNAFPALRGLSATGATTMGAKFYLLLLISFTVSVCNADYTYDIKWFPNMPIDHFSYADNRTFSLRYLVNNTHWKPHGPVFFYCGNEGDIELFAQNTGFMWDIAGEYNAMVVFAEHRFYGKTMPFGNQSYDSPGNLGYLSSEQALADYAKLLTWMKQNETSLGPVVAFGGSYGGMLAAWFRVKYPHVIVGAVASSAPILQFEGVTPCWTFGQIVTRTFARSGTNCDMVVKNAFPALRGLSATESGRTFINNQFNLCNSSLIKNKTDVDALSAWLEGGFGYLAMIDYPYPTNFLNPVPAWPVKVACSFLTNTNGTDEQLVTGLYNAISVYANYTGNKTCFATENADDTTQALGTDGWNFQYCTEMAMPFCNNGTIMFEKSDWNMTKVSDDCFKQFGVRPRFEWATTNYGGDMLQWASNIIFSNGDFDPWSGGGVTSLIAGADNSVHILKVNRGAHHLDLRSAMPEDNQTNVVQVRNAMKMIIHDWVNGVDERCMGPTNTTTTNKPTTTTLSSSSSSTKSTTSTATTTESTTTHTTTLTTKTTTTITTTPTPTTTAPPTTTVTKGAYRSLPMLSNVIIMVLPLVIVVF